MLKKLIISLMIISCNIAFSEKIRLASFNTLKLGQSKKDYRNFSKIISKFDIIAMQEVMNENGLIRIKKELNNEYDYIISEPVGTRKYKEYYAIMYKKSLVDKIKLVGKYKESNNEFIREPSAFYVKSNKLDMLLIPVHSIYGDNPLYRSKEAFNYFKVYKYFSEKTNQDDIIILGDFNVPASDIGFNNLKKENFVNILDPNYDKTTISPKGLVNCYDNIFINLNKTKAFTNRYGVYNFTKNNNILIRKYISDHLIIFIELDNEVD